MEKDDIISITIIKKIKSFFQKKWRLKMKKQDCLTLREEELLNILWEINEPMTTGEMVERLEKDGWNAATLFKTVRSLSDQGYLKIIGLEKTVKAYSRKFVPALTKEEYYAGVMMKRGLDINSIANITAAFLGITGKSDKERDTKVIAELEEIIRSLRKMGDKENGD